MPPKRGRGGGRGGRGGATTSVRNTVPGRVAKPTITKLPTNLQIDISSFDVPEKLVQAFPEFTSVQPFFSALERLRPELGGSAEGYKRCWIGVSGDHITSIERPDDSFSAYIGLMHISPTDSESKLTDDVKNVFVKRIHLLDPITYMEGDYVAPSDGALPAPSEPWKRALAKINDPLNEAYVDALFALHASKLVESGTSPHWCRCYGTFSARVSNYTFNITEEYDSLKNQPWWRRNQRNGLFRFLDETTNTEEPKFNGPAIDLIDGDFEDLEQSLPSARIVAGAAVLDPRAFETGINTLKHADDSEDSEDSENEPEISTDAPVQLTAPKLRLSRIEKTSPSSSSDDDSDDSDESEEDEEEMFVEFTNFPVQVTLLEKAEGTLDELLDNEDDDLSPEKESRWTAWLFQIIAGLSTAQHLFGFVHNDLHTNNIMWNNCPDITHLYYRIKKGKDVTYMKVPTFGKIMKIIDFGRASYHLPDPAGFFISDAFYHGNDAGSQYNCEPFYDSTEGKKVEPNPSFDLCRLAISLLDSLYPERPASVTPMRVMSREGTKMYSETTSCVYNMMWEWLQDDDGKNMLRTPTGDERYPDFDLYRAISADVHRAIPSRQIEKTIFNSYKLAEKDIVEGCPVYDLVI